MGPHELQSNMVVVSSHWYEFMAYIPFPQLTGLKYQKYLLWFVNWSVCTNNVTWDSHCVQYQNIIFVSLSEVIWCKITVLLCHLLQPGIKLLTPDLLHQTFYLKNPSSNHQSNIFKNIWNNNSKSTGLTYWTK